jgi:hypothetical protein
VHDSWLAACCRYLTAGCGTKQLAYCSSKLGLADVMGEWGPVVVAW